MPRKTTHFSGEKIGNFTLISQCVGKIDLWLTRCVCGREYEARVSCLHKQSTCRTCMFKRGSEHYAWRGVGELSANLFGTYRNGAEARNLPFEVSIEYLWNLFVEQKGKCALTGQFLYFNKTFLGQSEKTASPDRIDSTKGYIEGNIQWVHRDVNKLKKNMPNDLFIELCHNVAAHTQLPTNYE